MILKVQFTGFGFLVYSSIKDDNLGSASFKHRAKPYPKRVVELKLHRKSLTRMVCIYTYSYNVSILYNSDLAPGAPRATFGPLR